MAQKKKCHGCGERYEPKENDGSFVCWCSDDCAIIVARARQEKSRAKAAAKRKADVNKFKKKASKDLRAFNRRDVPWQHKRTKTVFNRMRVLEELKWYRDRNIEPECISCARTKMDWSCGHHESVGSNGRLRYSEFNTFLQCNKYCNSSLSANISGNKTSRGYDAGLSERFGESRAEWILEWCKRISAPKKWEWQELEEMRAGFAKRIRELEAD